MISRNAVFVHKGKPIKAQEIAREFGVDYIVEGSVRKAMDRVRVTVQLIDGETEAHVWAERYDRKLEDIFAIQDEVTSSIASTLFGRVEAARLGRAQRQTTENMAAYEYLLAGKILHHASKRESNAEALRNLNRAIAARPRLCSRSRVEGLCSRAGLAAQLVRGPARKRAIDPRGAADRSDAR